MGIGNTLTDNIKELGVLAMFTVIISVILLKFRANDSVICKSGFSYNTSENLCCLTNTCASNHTVYTTRATLESFVTGFSEPATWVVIIIIALIGITLFALFKKMKD